MVGQPFPYLLLPSVWASRHRVRHRQRGDLLRALVFGAVAVVVFAVVFAVSFWLSWQLTRYAELGDYLMRLGLSWLFLVFLSFLAFSGIVTALSTFFLAEDLRLLLAAPIAPRRLFYARFSRTVVHSSWMVVVFVVPVLAGVGLARCAPLLFYATALAITLPFVVIPVALGSAVTLMLVNVFPARRARDILMLMGLLFAAGLVFLLRFVQPERLMQVESLPDITDFFATLQSPITPLMPSFWAGEAIFASLAGGVDRLYMAALWTTALALTIGLRAASERWHFAGFSKAQEARKARFTRLHVLDRVARWLPATPARRHLFVKDLKVFLRDVSQWSQLLLLLALVAVYLFNFRVLDLDRIPYVTGVVKGVYALVNLGMGGFVMATIAVRFVFPAVSSEGAAFWIIRSSPVSMRDFLWSKFWVGLFPVLLLTEGLTVAANALLGIDPFLEIVAAATILCLSFALVGLATGLGARYPRFNAGSATEVAGSFGGVTFMILAVIVVLVVVALVGWASSQYLWFATRNMSVPQARYPVLAASLAAGVSVCSLTWWFGMRTGVRALESTDK